LSARDAMRKLAKAGLSAQMTGDGYVVSQDPAPGQPIENHRVCKVTLERVVFHAAAGAQP
jgi:PASTA domain